jgi:hypothetical protein
MTPGRIEQAAFHFRDDIIWVAYRYSGGGKEEVAYNAGWSFKDTAVDERGSQLYKVLDSQFGIDPHMVYQYANGSVRFGGPFAGCSEVFIDTNTQGGFQGLPENIDKVFMDYFNKYSIKCSKVDAPWQSYEDINARWAGPMGVTDVKEPDGNMGGARALSVMDAGISQKGAA